MSQPGNGKLPLDQGPFDIILADPPWDFLTRSGKGKKKSAARHYGVMSMADIMALPVRALAAPNCALFMWATFPHLEYAFQVGHAWGFNQPDSRAIHYRTLGFMWAKLSKTGRAWHMGLGYYTRSNPEVCLLFVRGRMPVAAHDVRSLVVAPLQEHSRKPDEIYTAIDRLYPNTRRVELFARRTWPGWVAWGDELI